MESLIMQNSFSINWIISHLLFTFIVSYLDQSIFIFLFKVNTKKSIKWFGILSNAILRCIYMLFLPVSYYRALNIITTIIISKTFFKKNIEQCVLGEVINMITIIVPEVIFSKIFCLAFPNIDTYVQGIYDFKYSIFLMSSISIFRLLIYIIIKLRNITIDMPEQLSKTNKMHIIIVSIIGCLIIFFNAIEMTLYITDFPYSIFILDIVSLILYFYISIQQVFRIVKLENQELKIQNLSNYNKTLTNMYDSLRGFRHDFSNFVQALEGYAKVEDVDGIKAMSRDILKDCDDVNSMEILNPKIINNPAVYSILSHKFYNAKQENIDIKIEMLTDLTKMQISTYELCRILSILLDNAIEAAKECDNKIINVKFIDDRKVNRNLVIIENSYNNKDIDIEKIFEKGETSKQTLDDKHGLGLWNIRKILKHSKNLNLFTSKNELFCQQLEIYY